MKISDVEENLKNNGFSENLFLEFQLALKRVPKELRCQHCYITAYELAEKDILGAIKLTEYGINNCDNSQLDLMRGYLNLGFIYEADKQFLEAKQGYEKALEVVKDIEAYLSNISMRILRMELHINNFSYTDELKTLFKHASNADIFERGMREFIFYSSIAKMIISEHENDSVSYKEAYKSAISALDGNKTNAINKILSKHKYKNEAKATNEAIAYLKKVKRKL